MNEKLLKLYSLPGMQEKFRVAMGPFKDSDWGINPGETEKGIVIDAEFLNAGDRAGAVVPLRLPLAVDDSSEEAHDRSLWGMVDHGKYEFVTNRRGFVQIYDRQKSMTVPNCWKEYYLTEALLLALAHQWGVEVPE